MAKLCDNKPIKNSVGTNLHNLHKLRKSVTNIADLPGLESHFLNGFVSPGDRRRQRVIQMSKLSSTLQMWSRAAAVSSSVSVWRAVHTTHSSDSTSCPGTLHFPFLKSQSTAKEQQQPGPEAAPWCGPALNPDMKVIKQPRQEAGSAWEHGRSERLHRRVH